VNLPVGYLVLLQTYPKITVFGVLQLRSVFSLCFREHTTANFNSFCS